MLNVSEAVKQRYLSDEFNGDYKLTIGNASYTGRNIQQGSLEITESLCSGENIDFSSVEMGQISLTLINFTEGIKDIQGKTLNLVQTVAGEDVPIATEYTVVNAKNSGEYLMDIVANDGLYAFQRDVTDWWNKEVKFPITHRNLLIALCNYCGVQYSIPGTYCNSTLSIKKSIDSDSITALEVLGWLQEVAGCFYRMNRYNVLTARTVTVKRLRPSVGLHPRSGLYPGTVDQEWVDEQSVKYTVPQIVSDLEVPDYEVAEIDKLQISGTINDVGVTAGEGTNCYKIVSNPLLFSFSTDELGTIARRIFNVLKGIKYRPFTAKLKGLPYVETGDLVQVTTLKGLVVLCPLLKRTMSGAGLAYDKFECKGNEKREQVTTKTGRNLRVLNQRTHEIVNTIDTLSSTITDIRTEVTEQGVTIDEHSTQISQTSEEIKLQAQQIKDVNGIVSSHTTSINQNANNILIQAQSIENIDDRVTDNTASIAINATNIALKVSQDKYNAGEIVQMINVDTTGVQIKASKLDLEFGDTSKVTIKATTENDGVLFDGTGKVEFNTKGQFYAKNIDTNSKEANWILLTNSSTGSSAELYNRFNDKVANYLDLETNSTTRSIIMRNNNGSAIQMNNYWVENSSTRSIMQFANSDYSTSATRLYANTVEMLSNSERNRTYFNNYTGQSATYRANEMYMNYLKSDSSKELGLVNYASGATSQNKANEVQLTSNSSTNSAYIRNRNSSGTEMNLIWEENSSARSLIQFKNCDYDTGEYANFVEITSNSTKNSATFYNYVGSAAMKSANMLQLLCDKNDRINKLILQNYDYGSSSARTNSKIQLTDSITFNAWNWFDFRFIGDGRQVVFGYGPDEARSYECRNFYINGVDIMPILGIN